jgi:UDP-N-acetylmuramyl pentapeptide synthase
MRTVGFRPEEISDLLSKVELPKNRMMKETVNGIEVLCETIKSQNSTATSVMYEAISREEGEKEIVMVMDEEFSKEEGPLCEVGTYIYDIDYEFLNDEHIKKIILAGDRCLDHKIRAMMAGIPEEKMVVTRKNLDAVQYVDVEGIDKIYVLRNYFKQTNGTKVYEEVLKKVAQGGKR